MCCGSPLQVDPAAQHYNPARRSSRKCSGTRAAMQRLRNTFVSQELLERSLWQWSTVKIALRLITAALFQVLELLLSLHAFGDGGQPEGMRKTNQYRHESACASVCRQPVGESAIDLQTIDGQVGEPAQGGITSPEVVYGNSHSGRA